ncbi:hypothetical protein [Ferrovibrio sp.]|uniref:hypothetical protein n=1 Tax=Ferrovibrio sp. TaxID=1917215 RepID=UPI003D2A3D66
MITDQQRGEIVARLLAARQGGPLFDPAGIAIDHADILAIQAGVMAALGPVGGWKVGRGAPDQPIIFAPIRASGIAASPKLWPREDSRLCGLELEIAFRIDSALPPLDAPDYAAKLAASVTPLPVFEVLDSRLLNMETTDAHWRLADLQINAGMITGAAYDKPWQPDDFIRLNGELIADASIVVDGLLTQPGGSPFDLLIELLRQVKDHCGGVQPGQIVTTGAFTGLRFFKPGTRLRGSFAGMAPLEMMFGA